VGLLQAQQQVSEPKYKKPRPSMDSDDSADEDNADAVGVGGAVGDEDLRAELEAELAQGEAVFEKEKT
jgi:hypothetical protein